MRKNKDRVLDFIQTSGIHGVTNADIREGTGIEPHQQIFQITRKLREEGLIQGSRQGWEWVFYPTDIEPLPSTPRTSFLEGKMTPSKFENLTRSVFSRHFDCNLNSGMIYGVPKEFDMVSPDKRIVGDAKYLTMVKGEHVPPAKFSVISEFVWLLEKTEAEIKFLSFGNDRRVPELWLKKYGNLCQGVRFYFMSDDGEIELLHDDQIG